MSVFFCFVVLCLACIGARVLLPSTSPLRNIPGPPPQSWFKGNLGQLFNAKGLPFHDYLVDHFGGIVKVFGFFGDEQLYISDPRALHSILITHPDAFEETSVFIETNKLIFGPGLISTTGEIHKKQRKITLPIFSSAQLRELTPVFYEIAERLGNAIAGQVGSHIQGYGVGISAPLDMSEWMSRVALESVGCTVLGYSFDPLDSPYNNPYTSAVKELIPTLFSLSLIRQFAPFLSRCGTPWFRRKVVELVPVASIQKVKHMSDVMYESARKILLQKQASMLPENDRGLSFEEDKDIISVLLRANASAAFGQQLSESELIGQMTVLIFGAHDTASSALCRVLYMLAAHPELQEQIRAEIRTALETSEGRLDYGQVMGLPWLSAVIKETLRLYPPVPFVRRTTTKDTRVPLSSPLATLDGSHVKSVIIPTGTTLFIGIAGANRLESVWGSDAKEWKPERWFKEKQSSDDDHRLPGIYGGMMTFLGGSRSCIGLQFALMEMKILLACLLSRFTFSLTKDEIVWNLSMIIAPSVKSPGSKEGETREEKGMPLFVRMVEQSA